MRNNAQSIHKSQYSYLLSERGCMNAIAPHFDPAKAPLPAALKEEQVSRKRHLSPCRLLATYIISTLMTGTGRSTIEDSPVLRRQFNLHESWPPGVLSPMKKAQSPSRRVWGKKISELFSSPVFRPTPPTAPSAKCVSTRKKL